MRGSVIISTRHKWQALKALEAITLGVGFGLLLLGCFRMFAMSSIVLPVFLAVLIAVFWLIFYGIFKITDQEVARFLSKTYPELENSMELLLAEPTNLNTVELLQREKIAKAVVKFNVALPKQWALPLVSLALGLVVFAFSFYASWANNGVSISESEMPISQVFETDQVDPRIQSITITITPPSYTRRPTAYQKTASIEAFEGSRVTWEVILDAPADRINLVFANGEKLEMNYDEAFTLSTRARFNDFYYFEISDKNRITSTTLFPITIIKDQGPIIDLPQRDAFQEFEFGGISSTKIVATISDDFGINSAKIVATVAKGSGESVRFREEEIDFETKFKAGAKAVDLQKNISLDSLKLEPGDELYFYVIAADNKSPNPNITKSETYFVSLIDTTEIEFSLIGNLGVDLMPEYFRSQRQIIIDTEKLIKSKPKLSKYDFNFTSNELGFDQKVLRLKYGQFMGEEFVSDAGGGNEVVEDVDETGEGEEDLTAEYTHAHDTENEHNILEVNDPGEEFGHSHDNEEENTYFSMSVKAKLKEAMAQMWDAELYLRLYQPQNSLPYQYKALELIKEIKNHARIYVQRMGFDPPPIKPLESRLKGKALKDVVSSRAKNTYDGQDSFKETRLLLTAINTHWVSAESIEYQAWQNAGNELAPLAIEEPGKFFNVLNQLQRFRDGNVENYDTELSLLYNGLYELLPEDEVINSGHHQRSKWNRALTDQLKLNQ